jgi:molybdenum cofactor guanylyltransferase
MGRDKAWLPYGAETQLAAVLRALAEFCWPLIVVGAAGRTLPPLPVATKIVIDREPFPGPLHGLALGLDALPPDCPGAFVSSCDVPGLRPEFIAAVCRRLTAGVDIALPFAAGRGQPLSAAYRRRVAPSAWALLAANRRRPMFLLDRHPHAVLPEAELRRADPTLASLCNANTPEEYAALVAAAGEPRGAS